jgi:eukaryotic-like serine/threonine-protein kinase
MSTWAVPGYTEERELGKGASGRVVAAVSQASGGWVAIKYLGDKLVGDPVFMAHFRYEADLQRSLDVPHIVQVFDYVEATGQGAAIVMELVDGVSLHEMIDERGPTSPEAALTVLKGSLLGLAAAHAAGIVHRDYKPENVLVDTHGDSKLADFGVAVRAGRNMSVAGTPLYMAPEQWNGAPNSPATDIYAATAVFYECLTGKTPFTGRIPQLRSQHETASVPLDTVDVPLRAMIARGMAKNPGERPRNAIQFIMELESTAAAAYGPDWEERGRGQLAARVAALLLLLWPYGGSPGSSGTSTSTYFAGGSTPPPPRPPAAGPRRRRRRQPARRNMLTVAAVAAVALVAVAAAATAVTLSSKNSPGNPDPVSHASSSASTSVSPTGSPSAPTLAAQAAVTPPVAASPCVTPTSFAFTGTITAPAGDTVSYQWVYSSGTADPVQQLHFAQAGQQQAVGGTVKTSTAGAGWAELKLTGPVTQTSNQAGYKLLCATPNSGITTTAAVQPATKAITCGTALPSFTATGSVTTKKAATVSYYWALSNGHTTTPATLTFTGPGTQAAAPYTITPSADPSSGDAVLVVTSPAAAASAPATYALSCKEPPLQLTASAAVSPVTKTLTACTVAAPAFTFTGSISDNQPGTVTYHWSLPTGNGPAQTLQFAQAGTKTVSTAFTPATDSATGSGSLVVTSPGSVTSSPATFTLTCPNALKINAAGVPATATLGQTYTGSFTVSGGNGTYTWNTAGLPSWLTASANGATLTVTGTPTTPAANTVTVSVKDSAAADPSANASETVTVNATAMRLSGTLSAATENEPSTASQITVTGGYGTYKWTATGLPTGMTQSSSGGTLTIGGTPTEAGTFTVNVTVSDGESPAKSVTQAYTLTVNAPPALSITTATLPIATDGVAYSATITTSGGAGTFTWTAANLPSGLSLSVPTATTALISGTPGAATSSVTSRATAPRPPVTLTVTDTAGQTVSKQFTLTVSAAPALTITTTPSTGTVGTAYSVQMAATGGTGSYTWSANTLPPGLAISSSGLISGTPTAVNTAKQVTTTITVADSNNASSRAEETLVIQVQSPPVILR